MLHKKITSLLICCILLSSFASKAFSQTTEEDTRALYLFNIAYGVKWENSDNIEKYTIGIFSGEKEFEALSKLAKTRVIGKKPVEVVHYEKLDDIKEHHIIYVSKNENAHLGLVYNKFKYKNVLLVSDRSKEPQYSVINFRKLNEGTQKFDINKALADKQKLEISLQILKLGGNREVLQEIYAKANRKLMGSEKKIKELEQELKRKEDLIKNQRAEIEELKKKLNEK